MSRFYPHAQYAEDQPYAHSILTGHVLARGFQVGSIGGLGVGTIAHLISRRKPPLPDALELTPDYLLRRPTSLKLLHSTGYGSFVGVVLLSIGLTMQMRGKEEIEWKDRSWRLLENKGQVQWDTWAGTGALAGLGAVLSPPVLRRYGGLSALGWRGVVGGVAVGSLVGLAGHLAFSGPRNSKPKVI